MDEQAIDQCQQGAALFVAAFAEVTYGQVDAAAGAADEAEEEAAQDVLAAEVFLGVGPGLVGGPAVREDEGVGERLVEALPPAAGADVEPELDVDGLVAQQEGVGGRQKDGVFGHAPAGHEEGADGAGFGELEIGAAEGGERAGAGAAAATAAGAGRDGLTAPGFVFERPAEAAGRLDELAGDTGGVAVLVEAVVGLAEQLAKEAGKELVKRRLFGPGAVAVEPGAQTVEVFAGGVGDALAHALVERRKGAQLVGAAARRDRRSR